MTIPDTPSEDIALLGEVNGNAYDAVTNPKGLARGGHRQNWASAMNALASVAAWVASVVAYITTLANQVATDAASAAAGSGTEATVSNIRSGLSAFYLSIRRVYEANAPVALTRASSTTWDMSAGINFALTLDGNVTKMANPANQIAGKSGLLRITQDGTGGRTIGGWGSHFKWLNGQAIMPSAANSVLIVSYLVWENGTIYLSNGGST